MSKRLERKRLHQKAKEITRQYKRRRLELKSAKYKQATVSAVREGDTYRTDVDLQVSTPDTDEIPSVPIINENECIVFFDLETTGRETQADIVQIAAISGDKKYNAYVIPRKQMSVEARQINKIEVRGSQLYCAGKRVETVGLKEALLGFKSFIDHLNCPLLVGHNIARFDVRVLYHSLCKVGITWDVPMKGCVDTLSVARKLYKKNPDVSNFSQSTLITELMQQTYDAHNAMADVEALQTLYYTKLKPSPSLLQELLFHFLTHVYKRSVDMLTEKDIISPAIASKLCKSGLTLSHLKLAYQRGGDVGVRSLLKENIAGKARVTSSTKILDSIVAFLINQNSKC